MVFAAVLLATAAACGASDEPDDRVITLPPLPSSEETTTTAPPPAGGVVYKLSGKLCEKADQAARIRLRKQYELGFVMVEDVDHLRLMIVVSDPIPQQFSETKPFVEIGFPQWANRKLPGVHCKADCN